MQTHEYDLQTPIYPIICTHHKLHSLMERNTQLSWHLYEATDRMWWPDNHRHIITGNMTIMGKVDTSDLMMTMRWVTNIFSRSPQLDCVSWTLAIPYFVVIITTYLYAIDPSIHGMFKARAVTTGQRLRLLFVIHHHLFTILFLVEITDAW